jgi:hypothetical protein
MTPPAAKSTVWTTGDVQAFLPRGIDPVRPGSLYHAGLIAVAASLVILQAIYVAMVALAGYATYRYLLRVPGIVAETHINFLTILLVATPAVVGVIVTFFLLKPLLSKVPGAVELLQLDPAAEPVLFAFVELLCRHLRAPVPVRIDIDLRVNASPVLGGAGAVFSRATWF